MTRPRPSTRDLPTVLGVATGYALLALAAGAIAAIPLLAIAWWVL